MEKFKFPEFLLDDKKKNLSLFLNYFYFNKQQLDQCKIQSDGFPIGSGTIGGDLGGITIWKPCSNESDANL